MKGKTYTHGITFFVCAQMHGDIKKVSDELRLVSQTSCVNWLKTID